jgi:hypothetical protein
LSDGSAIAIGGTNSKDTFGDGLTSAEQWTPGGVWTLLSAKLLRGRYLLAATALSNGSVAVAGGSGQKSVEILTIDPQTSEIGDFMWGAPMTTSRMGFGFVQLPNGSLLAAGGYSGAVNLDSAEVNVGSRWVTIQRMHGARAGCRAALLKNGSVLVAGASKSQPVYARSAELFATARYRCYTDPNGTQPSCHPSPDGTGSDVFTCTQICGR